jgi:type III secretion protein J
MTFAGALLYTSGKLNPPDCRARPPREGTGLEEPDDMTRCDSNGPAPGGVARAASRQHASARLPARVLLTALVVCSSLASAACGEKAVTSVPTETDAIEILDVLGQSGLDAAKRETGEGETLRWEIVVDEGVFGGGQAALAVQVLRDHGLPRPEERINDEGGLIPSERIEKLREQQRLRADIERQLRALPGVTLALVSVVMPQDSTLSLNPYPATASVVINYKEQQPSFNEEQVRNLVAKGVPNLKPQDVSVTMSQQNLRPVPQHELTSRRRGNILLAVGVGLVAVLGVLLVILLLQMRRQRAELAARQRDAAVEAADEEPEAHAAALAEGAPEPGLKRLDGTAADGAATR